VDGVVEDLELTVSSQDCSQAATWISVGVEDTLFALSRLRLGGDASETIPAL